MSLSITQAFDSVAPPSLPAGWTFGGELLTTTAQKSTSPNSLTIYVDPPSAAEEFGLYGTADTTATAWTVSCYVYLTTSNSFGGVAFNSSNASATGSLYHVSFLYSSTGANQKVVWNKRVSGTDTAISTLQPGTSMFSASRWYVVTVSGTQSGSTATINVTVQDTVTGKYLDNTGAWGASPVYCLSATDGSNIGPGYYGCVLKTPTGASTTFVDNVSISTSGVAGTVKIPWHYFFTSY